MNNTIKNNEQNPENQPADPNLSVPSDKITVINVDEIKPNSIVVITLDINNPQEKMYAVPAMAKLFKPYADKLKEKRISIMLMSKNEKLELVSEEEMNRAGWTKTNKSLIINPFQK